MSSYNHDNSSLSSLLCVSSMIFSSHISFFAISALYCGCDSLAFFFVTWSQLVLFFSSLLLVFFSVLSQLIGRRRQEITKKCIFSAFQFHDHYQPQPTFLTPNLFLFSLLQSENSFFPFTCAMVIFVFVNFSLFFPPDFSKHTLIFLIHVRGKN